LKPKSRTVTFLKAIYSFKTELKLMFGPGPQLALSYPQRSPIGQLKIEPVGPELRDLNFIGLNSLHQ